MKIDQCLWDTYHSILAYCYRESPDSLQLVVLHSNWRRSFKVPMRKISFLHFYSPDTIILADGSNVALCDIGSGVIIHQFTAISLVSSIASDRNRCYALLCDDVIYEVKLTGLSAFTRPAYGVLKRIGEEVYVIGSGGCRSLSSGNVVNSSGQLGDLVAWPHKREMGFITLFFDEETSSIVVRDSQYSPLCQFTVTTAENSFLSRAWYSEGLQAAVVLIGKYRGGCYLYLIDAEYKLTFLCEADNTIFHSMEFGRGSHLLTPQGHVVKLTNLDQTMSVDTLLSLSTLGI